MRVLKNDKILFCDVDDTLVLYDYPENADNLISVVHPISKSVDILLPHKEHIGILRKFSKQGFFIVVWSLGGWYWAEAVVLALGLKKIVNLVMSKPAYYIDDSMKLENILGEPLFRQKGK